MVDDFTRGYRGTRAPLDALGDRLGYFSSVGANAIELMPCTARPDDEAFSWGYDPTQFFAIENAYVEDPAVPLDRRSRLRTLVANAHAGGPRRRTSACEGRLVRLRLRVQVPVGGPER